MHYALEFSSLWDTFSLNRSSHRISFVGFSYYHLPQPSSLPVLFPSSVIYVANFFIITLWGGGRRFGMAWHEKYSFKHLIAENYENFPECLIDALGLCGDDVAEGLMAEAMMLFM